VKTPAVSQVERRPARRPASNGGTAFTAAAAVVLRWAMLDLNQRPPPCKGEVKGPGRFAEVHKVAYTSRFQAASTQMNVPVSTCTGVQLVY
jgi:hypothetical protein